MAKITINERLAQLISEKNMGVKVSSVNDISNTTSIATSESASSVKKVKTDSVEIKGKTEEGNKQPVSIPSSEVNTKKIVYDENPFIHNQVVDDIAKKLLKAFTG